MENNKLLLIYILLISFSIELRSQHFVINEFMAKNKKYIADGFGEYEDWLELYNPSNKYIDIGGMFVTDELSNPTKHKITENKPKWTGMSPNGYLLLWVDGDDEQGTRHLSIKIDYHGGVLAIYDRDTNLVDVVRYPRQRGDVSFGREHDGSTQMCFFENPTQNKANFLKCT